MNTATTQRRGRPRDEKLQARREEEILDAAAKLFARHGYASTDVDSVAESLGVGKGTIYRYFPSKRELFLAAVKRGMNQLEREVEAATGSIPDPLDRAEAWVYTFLAYFDKHPELVELFVQERAQFKELVRPAYFVHHEAQHGPRKAIYRKLVDEGRVRELHLARDYDMLVDLLYGTILANAFTGRPTRREDQARNIIDIFFNGILTDAERKRRAKKRSG